MLLELWGADPSLCLFTRSGVTLPDKIFFAGSPVHTARAVDGEFPKLHCELVERRRLRRTSAMLLVSALSESFAATLPRFAPSTVL